MVEGARYPVTNPSLVGIQLDNGDVLLKFLQTSAETGGEFHLQEARYAPHSKLPPYHRHPFQAERFSIVEGALQFRIDGVERLASQGEEVQIPEGALHQIHNSHGSA